MISPGKVLSVFAAEGLGGVVARVRRRWREWRFRPHVLEKRYGNYTFQFYVATREAQEWYGRSGDLRVSKNLGPELDWLARAAAPGDVVADVGAHHAYFSLLLAHWVGAAGKVYAFECLPENAEIAARNIALNGITNLELVRKAVGAQAGTVEIVDNSGGVFGPRRPGVTVLTAEMLALDEFFPERTPDLLKIDVEGFEYEVLKGARRCLLGRPKIALELHCFPFEDPVSQLARVLALLPREGYRYQVAFEDGQELREYALTGTSAEELGRRFNPALYGLPVGR